ncbi:MAG: hypothetical protein HRT42_10975 [Campylobacteraceae bacterium]|nr:hypothetical protein [Campylobacteraceae bacterium]
MTSIDNFDSAATRQILPVLRYGEHLSLYTWECRVKEFYNFTFITNEKILEITDNEEVIFTELIESVGKCDELDSLFSEGYISNIRRCSESKDIRDYFYKKSFILTECYTFLRMMSELFMKLDNVFIFNSFYDEAELIREELYLVLGINKCNTVVMYKMMSMYFRKYILNL